MSKIVVATLYKFVAVHNVQELQQILKRHLFALNIRGTLIVANEGINGTIAGSEYDINIFFNVIINLLGEDNLSWQTFIADAIPFKKTKVKVKKEIVTLRSETYSDVGEYIDAENWDSFIASKCPLIIDTRNEYEYQAGTFVNAISPQTQSFTDFPSWVEHNLKTVDKDKPIAMFCTGGIRCEKATKLVKDFGFRNVYHLKMGILGYLKKTNNKSKNWVGKCFVFDDRIFVSNDNI